MPCNRDLAAFRAVMLSDLPAGFELDHLHTALRFVTEWGCAVDVGAHVGIWSAELAKRFKRVVAFEPNPRNFEILYRVPGIEAHQVALGEENEECGLETGPENTGQWHLAPGNGTQIVALDAFYLPNLGFLKIDVEGFELPVLHGAAVTIERERPVILLEENGLSERYGISYGSAILWCQSHGYKQVAVCNKDHIFAPC